MDAKETRAYLNGSTAYSQPPKPRRGPLILCAIAAVICFTVFFSTSAVQEPLTKAAHNVELPDISKLSDIRNAFKPSSVHKPPEQHNSSSGATKWYSDWKWLNPFSSSITLEDDRVVLPPMAERPIIYTYYEPMSTDKDVLDEEKKLLLIWRRAWWAQGFKPIILGSKEAMQNPSYEALQTRTVDKAVKTELMRWLAWGWMGPGILTNWLLLPMAPETDPDLKFLRRGDYGLHLVRFETMGNSIYASSSKDGINKAIRAVMDNPKLDKQTVLQDAIPDTHAFDVQVQPTGLALYDMSALSKEYATIATELKEDKSKGLGSLQQLILSHLHGTFLEQFSKGIAILIPDNLHAAILASHSVQLADILNKCPESPLPESCPPNHSSCRACKAIKVSYNTQMTNKTDIFTIGIIPHPYTNSLLQRQSQELDVPWIRRSTRDSYVETVMASLAPKALSAYQKIITFKDRIANDETKHLSLFHSAERDWPLSDLEWHFGFSLSAPVAKASNTTKSSTRAAESLHLLAIPIDSDPPLLQPFLDSLGTHRPTRGALSRQANYIESSMKIMAEDKFHGAVDMREVAEAWNLADTEAWRFVSALNAREQIQRKKWEEEEKGFVGGK